MNPKKSPFEDFLNLGTLKKNDTEYEVPTELDEPKDVLEEVSEKPSFRLFYILCFIVSVVLLIRLLDLQVTHGYENRFLAEGNRARLREIEPQRGIISDHRGQPLVRNVPSYNLEISPADLPKKKSERLALYNNLSQITKIPVKEISEVEKNAFISTDAFIVKENIDRDVALSWECQITDLPAVAITKRPRRQYENFAGYSHILGYVGKISKQELPRRGYSQTSQIGKTGVENSYEEILRGQSGHEEVEVDAQGRLQRTLSSTPAEPGNNLVLGIDNRLQTAAADALTETLKTNNKTKGTLVALDPRNGLIRALVSFPAYDNNLFAKGITAKEYNNLLKDSNHPMVDRAISGSYPSGSVIKPMIASAGLQEKVITENTKLDTSAGKIKIGEWEFTDWAVHGVANVQQALAESNDIFFYAVGGGYNNIRGLGATKLISWLQQFGFGAPTQIDLPSENSGLVPDDEWKQKTFKESWYLGDTYHMSIGQGYFLTTPLQLANATAAVANGGELLKPHVGEKIVDNSGTIIKTIPKEVIRNNFINPQYLQVVRNGMRYAVTNGSASQLNGLPVAAAGKTGTAQFGDGKRSHAWFSSFAPYDKAEIVVVVMVEDGGEGHLVAQPVAKKFLSYYFSLSSR